MPPDIQTKASAIAGCIAKRLDAKKASCLDLYMFESIRYIKIVEPKWKNILVILKARGVNPAIW